MDKTGAVRPTEISVFLSHSAKDCDLAFAFVELLKNGLVGLDPRGIRCTSLAGHQLPGGENTERALREQAKSATAFIAIVTQNGLASTFMMCEVGARWGADKKVLPFVVGLSRNALEKPMSNWNAYSVYEESDIYHFVEDVGELLNLKVRETSCYCQYARKLEKLCSSYSIAAEKVWSLENCKYLIVFPRQRVKGRKFPVFHAEDVMAVRLIEDYLHRYRAVTEYLPVTHPKLSEDAAYAAKKYREIEEWADHVIYVCANSIPKAEWNYLANSGFPYSFQRDTNKKPRFVYKPTRSRKDPPIQSPLDKKDQEPRDYALVAKFKRAKGHANAYIVTGLHGFGTWGAASFLQNVENIQKLASEVGEKSFYALLEVQFDPEKFEITKCELQTPPRIFTGLPVRSRFPRNFPK
jgi:hypothetical protein